MNVDEYLYREKHHRCRTCYYMIRKYDGKDGMGENSYCYYCGLKMKYLSHPFATTKGIFCKRYRPHSVIDRGRGEDGEKN